METKGTEHPPLRVVCVGHAALDYRFNIEHFPPTPQKVVAKDFEPMVGGMGGNAAIAATRLGVTTRLVSRVGDDAVGDTIVQALQAQGVDVSCVARLAGQTSSVSSVVIDAVGERMVIMARGDALHHPSAINLAHLQGAQAVLVDPRWAKGAYDALVWASQNKVVSVLDGDVALQADLQRLAAVAQWAVFSEHGLNDYAGRVLLDHERLACLQRVIASGAQLAAVTLGSTGVLWTRGEKAQHLPAFLMKVKDTNGAGDTFHAALAVFLARCASEETLSSYECESQNGNQSIIQTNQDQAAFRYASAAAALKCASGQGIMGAPFHKDVLEFIKTVTYNSLNDSPPVISH